jgi:effector-binding domain-containing protein
MGEITVPPRIVERAAQPYVSITGLVTMRTIPEIADRMPEVFGWLAGRGVEPAGAPFFKFNLIDMERELEIEVGVPVAEALDGDDVVRPGVLPAGRYASLSHLGHPQDLIDATARLLDWAAEQGLTWDKHPTDRGERWGCRLELYKSDPAVEPDMNKWETELAFRLAD